MKEYTKTYGGGTRELVLLSVLSLLFYFPASAKAHAGNLFNQGENLNSSLATSEYRVGPGDVLSITVMDASEFGGKFRVSDSRKIEIAGVPSPFQAEGLSPIELSRAIREALIDARQLRDPKVNVFVEEFHDRTITVLGAVSKPGVYPLQKRTTVLEVLSLAGGALPNAGNTVTIVRGAASVEATGTSVGSVQIIAMNRLVKGEDLSANVPVQNGDTISVSAAQIVYVVGAVTKAGGFAMADPSAVISVVQAIALAEGLKPLASIHNGLVIRQSTSTSARAEIPVDISQMIAGKGMDMPLAPNDILYIPESGAKKTWKAMGDIAIATVNGIAIYGVGYRIGTHP